MEDTGKFFESIFLDIVDQFEDRPLDDVSRSFELIVSQCRSDPDLLVKTMIGIHVFMHACLDLGMAILEGKDGNP